ncbi:MAG: hypothetical protein ACRD2P_05685 [Terriglobia bacterium]
MKSETSETTAGLCGSCRHARVVRSDRGSVFYKCQRSMTDPAFPAYPRIPVLRCSGFERRLATPAAAS